LALESGVGDGEADTLRETEAVVIEIELGITGGLILVWGCLGLWGASKTKSESDKYLFTILSFGCFLIAGFVTGILL